jgi:uncharacterized cupredoxin-like copper-binding protein
VLEGLTWEKARVHVDGAQSVSFKSRGPSNMRNTILSVAAALAVSVPLLSAPLSAHAEGEHGHGHDMHKTGQPGKAENVSRTINIEMHDNYFEPEALNLKEGETARFVVTNKGEFVHEFNIATAAMHETHGPEMQMMVDHGVLEPDRINWDAAKKMQETMGHGMHMEGNSILLEPGQTGELIWKFPKHASLEFACNIPGHYDSGMMGDIKLSH